MFVLVNDSRILRSKGEVVRIGRAADATLRLTGPGVELHHCEIIADDRNMWWIKNLTARPLLFNGTDLSQDHLVEVSTPSEIKIGTHFIQLRDSAGNGAISHRLRRRLFELESELHSAILDRLRNATTTGDSKEERRRIEVELDRQLTGLRLDKELETYLATQALTTLLMNKIHGYGEGAGGNREYRRLSSDRYSSIVGHVASLIQLDSDRTAAEKTERVEVLLPWALQVKPGLLQSSNKRELAIDLLRSQLIDLMFGLGPLEDLLEAQDINDIMVLPSGQIFIERNGQMQDSGRKMPSSEISRLIVARIVNREGRRIDQSSPMVDARLADGSRLNAIIEPVAVDGPALTIRRFADRQLSIKDLVENRTLTRGVAEFLRACIVAKKSMVISGGTGSGKTTLLNALASYIPSSERIVTVEDTAEIRLSQDHVVTLQSKPPNLEGESAITIRQLVRNSLRMRPDRIIVGECRGGEALDMLQAMNTGHDGSLTTIHSNSPSDAVRRLEVMAMEAEGINLPSRALREQIISAVDVIVQISRSGHRSRRVTSICEVVGIDEENGAIILEEMFTYRTQKTKGAFSRAKLSFTGYLPSFLDELLDAGAELTCLYE